MYEFLISFSLAVCPAHLILHERITKIAFFKSTIYEFLHPPIFFVILPGPKFLLKKLFSVTVDIKFHYYIISQYKYPFQLYETPRQ